MRYEINPSLRGEYAPLPLEQESARVNTFLLHVIIPQTGPRISMLFEQERLAGAEANSPIQLQQKTPGSNEPTSHVDQDIDGFVRGLWERAFPNYPMLSEDSEDTKLAGLAPEQVRELPDLAIVDDIDGTGMMGRGAKIFSSSYYVKLQGQDAVGIVHRPAGGRLWVAQYGVYGAQRDGRPIHVSKTNALKRAVASTAYAWDESARENNLVLLHKLGRHLQQPAYNRASSVLDIIKVAEGQVDAHYSYGLHPWDVAAAAFIATKAGGKVTTLDGGPWDPFCDNILVTNGIIHDEMVNRIQESLVTIAKEERHRRMEDYYVIRRPSSLLHEIGERVRENVVFDAIRHVREGAQRSRRN